MFARSLSLLTWVGCTAIAPLTAPGTARDEEGGALAVRSANGSLGFAVPVSEDRALIVCSAPQREIVLTLDDGSEQPCSLVGFDQDVGAGLIRVPEQSWRAVTRGKEDPEQGMELQASRTPAVAGPALAVTEPVRWLVPGRPRLGLQLAFDGSMRVTRVGAGSAGERAGVRVDDRLLRWNGEAVSDRSDMLRRLESTRAGNEVELVVEREGVERTLSLVLAFAEGAPSDAGAFAVFQTSCSDTPPRPGTPLWTDEGSVAGIVLSTREDVTTALAAAHLDVLVDRLGRTPVFGFGGESEPTTGTLITRKAGAFDGYTMFSKMNGREIVLLDMDGEIVHRWECESPAFSPYLLDDGSVLYCAVEQNSKFRGGGGCGRIQRRSWDGELLWDYVISDEQQYQHHDIEPLPNGNVLALIWEEIPRDEALLAGRDPTQVADGGLWCDSVVEIAPRGESDGEVVWKWRVFDHLVQDRDPDLTNFGAISEHPGRIDINAAREEGEADADQRRMLQQLGYLATDEGDPEGDESVDRSGDRGGRGDRGRGGPGGRGPTPDWTHVNGIDYNAELDQILLSVRMFSEVWIIDHGTSTEEAASSEGGKRGRGGDLLYRFGNARRYHRGSESDQVLFGQHDARWIPVGHPGAGNITVFNNGAGEGMGGRGRGYSSVDEFAPPLESDGVYFLDEASPYEPWDLDWSYSDEGGGFSSMFISGAHRLPNGNTFICSGAQSRLFEVTPGGEVVWEYQASGGFPGGFPGGGPGGFPRGSAAGADSSPPDDDGAPAGAGGPGDARRGNFGGRGGGPGGIFRATRIAADHPGLAERTLKPLEAPDS